MKAYETSVEKITRVSGKPFSIELISEVICISLLVSFKDNSRLIHLANFKCVRITNVHRIRNNGSIFFIKCSLG